MRIQAPYVLLCDRGREGHRDPWSGYLAIACVSPDPRLAMRAMSLATADQSGLSGVAVVNR